MDRPVGSTPSLDRDRGCASSCRTACQLTSLRATSQSNSNGKRREWRKRDDAIGNSDTRTTDWESRIGRRVTLRDLHVLSTVVRWGSMAKAASHLAMSQSAVSESIAHWRTQFVSVSSIGPHKASHRQFTRKPCLSAATSFSMSCSRQLRTLNFWRIRRWERCGLRSRNF